jgi:RNA polymerase sigma-70 factor (ECF subfamily)
MDETELVRLATRGNRAAYETLVAPHVDTVRGLIYRMVGHPDDAADLLQESLLKAFEKIGTYRRGARFGTWLCSIAVNACLDHLRKKKRWRPYSQSYAEKHCASVPEMRQEILNVLQDAELSFDVREHIAACFTCVARSLDPMDEAAIVLSEIFEYTNEEAARALGVTEPVLRNHLAGARASMQETFEGLCALVNKQGICYQCSGFRNAVPEPRKGPVVAPIGGEGEGAEQRFRVRLRIVRETPFDGGKSKKLHELLFRRIREQEDARGDPLDYQHLR